MFALNFLCLMMCDLKRKASATTSLSASASDSGPMIRQRLNIPGITTVCIRRRTSSAGSSQEEQHAKGYTDGQPKVGPLHRGTAPPPATNGESWTTAILVHFWEWRNKSTVNKIYISHVCENRRWW